MILHVQWFLYFTTLYFGITWIIRPPTLVINVHFLCYVKTTCHIRPHLQGPMGGLKLEGPLYLIPTFMSSPKKLLVTSLYADMLRGCSLSML